MKPFGYHLILDLYNCKKGVCDNLNLCYDFLDKITSLLHVNKQAPPLIFRTDEEKYPDKAGISAWVPLVESSISIHTLSVKNFVTIDIYSCKEFDVTKTIDFVKKYFQPKNIEKHLLERGINYYNTSLK